MKCFLTKFRNFLFISLMTMISTLTFGRLTYRISLDDDKVTHRDFLKSASGYNENQTWIGSTLSVAGNNISSNDANLTNNNFTWSPLVANNTSPNLTASISGSAMVMTGQQTTYSISVSNIGDASTTNDYSISLTLPAGFVYNSFTGSNWAVTTTNQNDGSVLLKAQSTTIIAAGGTAQSLVISVTPSNSLANGSNINLIGNVAGGGDITPINNSFNYTVIMINNAKPIFSSNVIGSSSITAGSASSITYNISNIGTASSSGIYTLTITLPTGLTYSSFIGNGWTVVSTVSGGITTLKAQSSSVVISGANAASLGINFSSSASLSNNTSLSILGVLSGGGTTTNVNTNFDLKISQGAAPSLSTDIKGLNTILSGTSTNLIISVMNKGNLVTNSPYTFTATLPAGIKYNSTNGSDWAVTAAPQANGTTILTAISSVPISAGGTNSFEINITPKNADDSNLLFTINSTISGGGSSNNNFAFSMTVNPIQSSNKTPDMTVLITGLGMVQSGTQANYTITVFNEGGAASNGFYSVSTVLPKGFAYISAMGNDWNCSATPQPDGSTLVVCESSKILAAGAKSTDITLKVAISSSLITGKSYFLNSIISGGGEQKTNNNIASVGVSVFVFGNTILNFNGSGSFTQINQPTNFMFSITNSGSGSSSGIYQFHVFLPNGVSFYSVTGNGWSCNTIPQSNRITKLVCQSSNPILVGNGNTINISLISNVLISNLTNIFINPEISGGITPKPMECVCN